MNTAITANSGYPISASGRVPAAGAIDAPDAVGSARPEEKRQPAQHLPWRRIIPASALAIVAVLGTAKYLRYAAGFVSTDDSYLEADVHPISPRINGTVSEVLVQDNQHVEAGQPLVAIDPADLSLAVQAGEGDLAQAQADQKRVVAEIARARAEVEAAGARIAQNAAQLELARLDFNRAKALTLDGADSTQALDQAKAAYLAAQGAQRSLVAARDSAQADLDAAQAQNAVASAEVQKA